MNKPKILVKEILNHSGKFGKFYVGTKSVWNNRVSVRVGDILTDGEKSWTVSYVSAIFEGCFGVPEFRSHDFACNPIDHESPPAIGSYLWHK
jgi:hypothetical protein